MTKSILDLISLDVNHVTASILAIGTNGTAVNTGMYLYFLNYQYIFFYVAEQKSFLRNLVLILPRYFSRISGRDTFMIS